jgi:hypothetical protein
MVEIEIHTFGNELVLVQLMFSVRVMVIITEKLLKVALITITLTLNINCTNTSSLPKVCISISTIVLVLLVEETGVPRENH